ncbi:hypothetical protein VTL71DRAFT_14899 [Oculimacula yallundae]|uniref:Uncharacterized protein n=1 Tax=Oculimacula yallundae TaxID=86028 RepID=A0ABR4CFU6_9HELO
MGSSVVQTVEDAFEPIYDDIARMKYTLAEHHFNFKLNAVTDLRYHTSYILAITGIQQPRKDSPSAMCTTNGVMEIIEEDIDTIRNAATADSEAFLQQDTLAELRARMADVLSDMREETVVKIEPEPGYEDRATSIEGMFGMEGTRRFGGDAQPKTRQNLPNRSKMKRYGDWTPYLGR